MTSDALHRCRICGLLGDDLPYGEDGKTPTFEYCDCCGVEHGYQDCTPEASRRFRAEWIASGAAWESPKTQPANWDRDEQLAHVPAEYR